MNAVEREPVPTRVLNSNTSEVSYKPKQRSYRKTSLKKKFWRPIVPVPKCPAPKRRRQIGGAETHPTLISLCVGGIRGPLNRGLRGTLNGAPLCRFISSMAAGIDRNN